jgi:hypothetical protein
MTGEKRMFSSYIKNKDPQDSIIFGDGNQGKVKGLGKIAISSEHSISNVFLVESLGYNLLSVSQLCNMGYNCLFTNVDVSVFRRSDSSLAFKGVLDGKLYLVDFAKEEAGLDACLIAKTSMGWLWHRRLAHVGMKNLHKRPPGEGSERPQESACPVLGPARPTFSKKALVLPFIVVRRGSRCTMGGVAECYVSSGGRASALSTCQCGSRRDLGTLLA